MLCWGKKDNPQDFRHVDNKIVNAINFYTRANIQINEEMEETDMCYATKTADVCSMIKACVGLKHTLKETVAYVLSEYSNDEDITEAYITEQYNSFLQKKNIV